MSRAKEKRKTTCQITCLNGLVFRVFLVLKFPNVKYKMKPTSLKPTYLYKISWMKELYSLVALRIL